MAEIPRDSDAIMIPRRFRGPPDSANGGYACGVLGCRMHGHARVRLHAPPPLDTAMTLRTSDGSVELVLGDRTIASGRADDRSWQVPPPVDYDRAAQATRTFPWYAGHPFPSCFVCGPERLADDGLRLFPGAIAELEVVAAPWVPLPSVCDASGHVQQEIIWSALDCPSWFGILAFERDARYALLGELTVRIAERPREQERCVVLGWANGREGRKLYGGAAIFGEGGRLLASSAATWVELKAQTVQAAS